MPLSVSDLISEALANTEIRAELGDRDNDVDARHIQTALLDRLQDLGNENSSLLSELTEAERALENARGHFERVKWGNSFSSDTLITLLAVLFLAGMVIFILWLTGLASPALWFDAAVDLGTWSIPALIIRLYTAALIAAAAGSFWSSRWKKPRALAALARSFDIPSLEAKALDAKTRARERLMIVLEQNVREIINEFKNAFFQDQLVLPEHSVMSGGALRVTRSSGLSEVEDPAQEIDTPYRRRLLALLRTLPGASIGVSGARGVGKSTILRSIAGTLKIDGREAIAVYTSAPVRYDAREFLLHLYSIVCLQVLRNKGLPDEADRAARRPDEPSSSWLAKRRAISAVLILTGATMTAVGIFFAVLTNRLAPIGTGTSGAPVASPSPIAGLNLQPGALLQWGVTALVLGVVLFLLPYLATPHRLLRLISSAWTAKEELEEEAGGGLVAETRSALRDIRFQRSYTYGWSGALKIPLGFEAGSTGSAAFAQRPESLPELVEKFRNFIKLAVGNDYHRVIIAIDELDKIRSVSDAEEFLNEIKSVFNIPKCFYLVAVSENAISSFERRGLAIRDAFDSAFDDIHYIAPLDLEGSRTLIARRVLNLPAPFLCLCHALSGGLPRDLIRITRAMIAAAAESPAPPLLEMTALMLIRQEAEAKLRASSIVARDFAPDPRANALLVKIAELGELKIGSAPFRVAVKKLAEQPDPSAVGVSPAAPDADAEKVDAIANELAVYLEFLDLVILMTRQMNTAAAWLTAQQGLVEAVARARQGIEANPEIARVRFKSVRLLLPHTS